MLWFGGHCMFVFLELFDDIPRHQNVQHLVVVISLQLDATVEAPSQSLVSSYLCLRHFIKWLTLTLLPYFTPKLLTTRVKKMGRVSCFHSPSVCCIWNFHGEQVVCPATCLLGSPLGGDPTQLVASQGKCDLWWPCEVSHTVPQFMKGTNEWRYAACIRTNGGEQKGKSFSGQGTCILLAVCWGHCSNGVLMF